MSTIIQTPTPNLERSIEFYSKLDFDLVEQGNSVFAVDSQSIIEINTDRFARAGMKLYKPSWQGDVEALQEFTTVLKTENGYLLADPGNTWVYLIEGEAPMVQKGHTPCLLGNYAGFSLEMVDMGKGASIWNALGFKTTSGGPEQGWVALQNEEGTTISLMRPNSCPHLFFNPSLTYFNGKEGNPKVIQALRDHDIPLTEEITHFNKEGLVDNVIVRDPGGFGFFVFND